MWPPQDHQRGETQGEGQATAKQQQKGQVGFDRQQMACVALSSPRSYTQSVQRTVSLCFCSRSEELRQCQAATLEQMERYEAKHLGGFKRIYPREGGEKYDKYFKHSSSLFQETAASKAREECARYPQHAFNKQSSPTKSRCLASPLDLDTLSSYFKVSLSVSFQIEYLCVSSHSFRLYESIKVDCNAFKLLLFY